MVATGAMQKIDDRISYRCIAGVVTFWQIYLYVSVSSKGETEEGDVLYSPLPEDGANGHQTAHSKCEKNSLVFHKTLLYMIDDRAIATNVSQHNETVLRTYKSHFSEQKY